MICEPGQDKEGAAAPAPSDPARASAQEAFAKLYDVIVRLRAPDGCPWDREQNPSTLRSSLIEETYECVEAIDEKESSHIREELGDLYLLVTMIAYMHQQEGTFTVGDALEENAEKLIRRHPHVFGEIKVKDSAEVLENWARIKVEQEGRKPKDSVLDQVPRGLPPLDRAFRLQKKAAKSGFDWPDLRGVIAKIREELEETEAAHKTAFIGSNTADGSIAADDSNTAGNSNPTDRAAEDLEGELGDLLFSVINLCRYLKIDPSTALHRTNIKFERRFKHVEKMMAERRLDMKQENLAIMDRCWEEAKKAETKTLAP
ncbi:MAG: nucleoside triphosphate pyrophosphohydrolase [Treponema sp.]|jgi:tetrapyrrole methylase family protein/MazG family protein|nr:nucleoside triphosphate pyrophosphohydrolase [Treponema sp.]